MKKVFSTLDSLYKLKCKINTFKYLFLFFIFFCATVLYVLRHVYSSVFLRRLKWLSYLLLQWWIVLRKPEAKALIHTLPSGTLLWDFSCLRANFSVSICRLFFFLFFVRKLGRAKPWTTVMFVSTCYLLSLMPACEYTFVKGCVIKRAFNFSFKSVVSLVLHVYVSYTFLWGEQLQ